MRLAHEFGVFEELIYAYEGCEKFDQLSDQIAKSSGLVDAGTKVTPISC